MLDIRCVYRNTIALHACDHQFLVIGEEIGRAQHYADPLDLIVRYDSQIYQYGHLTIRDYTDHLRISHNDRIIIYDKGISDSSLLPDHASILLLDLQHSRQHLIQTIEHLHPTTTVIMPTVDQETAIKQASDVMRAGLTVPKYLKEGQYISVDC